MMSDSGDANVKVAEGMFAWRIGTASNPLLTAGTPNYGTRSDRVGDSATEQLARVPGRESALRCMSPK